MFGAACNAHLNATCAGEHLNRAATRRWLRGEATREATHELLASTLEHVLRTFGSPAGPRTSPTSRAR